MSERRDRRPPMGREFGGPSTLSDARVGADQVGQGTRSDRNDSCAVEQQPGLTGRPEQGEHRIPGWRLGGVCVGRCGRSQGLVSKF